MKNPASRQAPIRTILIDRATNRHGGLLFCPQPGGLPLANAIF
jgi:hypothetical protein